MPQLSPTSKSMRWLSRNDYLGSELQNFKNIPSKKKKKKKKKKGTYKRLRNLSKAWGATYRQVQSMAKISILVIFIHRVAHRGYIERKVVAAIISAVVANIICNSIIEQTTKRRCKNPIKKNKGCSNNNKTKTLSVWEDEERIQKALEKSKRSKTWVDQSMMTIEETNHRISNEKAQEEALREAQRKKMAKEWVAATMRSQSLAIEEAKRKKREEEEAMLRARKWAESMIRNTGINL